MAARHKASGETTSVDTTSADTADTIDRQLERYRSMRDFKITAEPSGAAKAGKAESKPKANQLPFVIQKHAATRLHYDFRLGWNGVLKSWAVAKGPSYYPGDKRLAVQVEDHPMEYGGFEGIIPKGQYGGGTVMLWDEGTWDPQAGHTDVDEGLRSGSLKFTLRGTKMEGNWALVRMGGKAANESKPNWLLIKEHDGAERGRDDPPITEESPDSVITGRSLEEIASSGDHVWNSAQTATGHAWHRSDNGHGRANAAEVSLADEAVKEPSSKPVRASSRRDLQGSLPKDTPKEPLPQFIPPQLATHADAPPGGSGWLHELKLDGYRVQARKDGGKVQLLTRTGLDWTHRMKAIAAEVAEIPAESLIADGEVVVLADDGTTSFADLQAAFQDRVRKPLTYFVFDLLHYNGYNLREVPLIERRKLLAALLSARQGGGEALQFSEHLETGGEIMFAKACELHAEGIVSKRSASHYKSGRSSDWLKVKCVRQQELVIGGFTLPSNGAYGVGALLLGYYADGKLIYVGRTGTGFTQKTHRSLRDRLGKLRRSTIPFARSPAEARRGALWVKPELVAEIRFATWTADGLVRQASFQGLREDKPAREVSREESSIAATPLSSKQASSSKPIQTTETETPAAAPLQLGASPVRLTHPEKILDADSGLTKRQLAEYYSSVAPYMLPHIAGRPLSLVRCPEGTGKSCFFQKHAGRMLPPDVESVEVPDKKTGKPEAYITLSTPAALAELAQMGVLEVHPWGSRNENLEHPDRITIDLDPDAAIDWQTLAASAADVRKQLASVGLESFLKTTGGKGLHVVVPIEPAYEWPVVKQFAHAFASEMEKREPSLYLTKMSKAARKGRIFIDYLRNERGATAVAPYSPRARAGAAVSLPLPWTALKLPQRPVFAVADFAEWKDRLKRDPWKKLPLCRQRITPEMLTLFRIAA